MNGTNRTRGRSSGRPRGGRRHSSGSENGQPNGNGHARGPKKSKNPLVKAWESLLGLFVSKPGKPQTPITSPRLYIGNLSYETTEAQLREFFNAVAPVAAAEVIWDRNANRSRGFAFVEMETLEAAQKVANKLHNKEFMGRRLIVSGAKSEGERQHVR